ncbi:hypothetical protein ACFZBA_36940, partial [Streptomyces sioyaensis]
MVKRSVLAHRAFTGISRCHLACLVEELAGQWQANVEGRRHAARGGPRRRAAGAGARHQLVFIDRLTATLIHLRHDLPHAVLGLLYGVTAGMSTGLCVIGVVLRFVWFLPWLLSVDVGQRG